MTIAEIKEKIKTNTKIPADMKEQIIGKIPYLKMPQLEKLAALLSYEEEPTTIKIARILEQPWPTKSRFNTT